MQVRTYSKNDWAVRWWLWLNGGKQVEPTSFCQFWRAVLLWVPLAVLLPFLRNPAGPEKYASYWQTPVVLPRKAVPLHGIAHRCRGVFSWLLRACVEILYWILVRPCVFVHSWFRNHPRVGETLGASGLLVLVVVSVATLVSALVQMTWWQLLLLPVAVLGTVVLLVVARIVALWVVAIGELIGTALIASKHRVCPLMHIRWDD